MKKIEVNGLELQKAIFDYEKERLICECVDNDMVKIYYLPFERLRWSDYEYMVIQVMEEGYKLKSEEF